MRKVVILAAAVALLAGCGGGGGAKETAGAASSSPEAASVAPLSTALLLRLDTAFDSPEWKAFDTLLRKFPDGTKLYSSIGGGGTDFERDVKPALGPETDAVALTTEDLGKGVHLALTQPRDDAKLRALLAKDKSTVSEQIGDWRVIADDRATIDRFKRARNGGTLDESDAFKEAIAALPAGALATFYVSGAALTKAIDKQAKAGNAPIPGIGTISWLAGALSAKDQGIAVDFRLKADKLTGQQYTPELPAEVPGDVSLFIDFKGLDTTLEQLKDNPAVSKQLGPAQQALGGLLDEVIALFKNEGAFYVRQQPPGPEYVFVLEVTDEQAATSTLDRLATLAGALSQKAPEDVTVAGTRAKKLTLGTITLYYAVFDGRLVLTNAESGIEGLTSGGERLAGTQAWQGATAAASMPDTTAGIVYADVQQAVSLIERLSKKQTFSAQMKRNLAPLGTALLFGGTDGGVLSLKGFVSVR